MNPVYWAARLQHQTDVADDEYEFRISGWHHGTFAKPTKSYKRCRNEIAAATPERPCYPLPAKSGEVIDEDDNFGPFPTLNEACDF